MEPACADLRIRARGLALAHACGERRGHAYPARASAALALLVISLHGAVRARALGEAIDTLRIDRVALVVAFALTAVWAVRLLV
jgi:hypothetical protein